MMCEHLSDFDCCDMVFLNIVEKEESEGTESLNSYERTVLFVWHTYGLVGNGGIRKFLLWEDSGENTAVAFDNIECKDLADKIRLCLNIYADYELPLSSEQKSKIIEEKAHQFSKYFETANQTFWDNDDRIIENTAKYIKINIDEFNDVVF